ncbi:MAG: aspartate transaminase [Gammaproteobacteria bacterium]|nr:MAG: aspartate transaminase [Gammaproteobacteria bacterium]
MPELSQCLTRFSPSLIGEMSDLARQMILDGKPVYDLTSGEPDFDTDPAACLAGHAAIDNGETKYTATDGSAPMKAAIRRKFLREGHPSYADDQLAVGSGAKPLLANILMTLLNPGDEVIIPGPCWASYPGMVKALGADAVIAMCDSATRYRLDAILLKESITPQTRAIILCTPSNPTGTIYCREELLALAEVLREHPQIWIIVDEIYSEILYDGLSHESPAVVAPDMQDRIITINGVSKSHAMTGWRIGYAAGPRPMMDGLRQLMSQVAGSPCSISQAAATAALDGPHKALLERRDAYQRRRDRVLHHLGQIHLLKTTIPEGAFYLYIDCSAALGKRTATGEPIESSADLAMYFLKNHGVGVVPAEAFEASGAFRISFASSLEQLEQACAGIANACGELS